MEKLYCSRRERLSVTDSLQPTKHMKLKPIIILYHADCPDGFGGAFAAWKKFGNKATYLPAENRMAPEWDISGKEVYIIDFSYPKEVFLEIEKKAERLVVLDHHASAKEAVESVREHIFDNEHSGAGLAWKYFHSDKPLPKLLAFVEDSDLWKHSIPNWKEIGAYLSTVPFNFIIWDKLATDFENKKTLKQYIKTGKTYAEYFDYVCKRIVDRAEMVEFEGYRILLANAPNIFESAVGNLMVKKHPPLSMLWGRKNGYWHFSLRGDGSVDVSEIAKRYGGGGHHNASGFRLPADKPLPFKNIDSAPKKR